MNKRAFIIHGWGADSKANWFAWVREELEKAGFDAVALDMPNSENPKQEQWFQAMQDAIGDVNENTYLIGHSLGTMAILRFLETLPEDQKVGGAILVSGFARSLNVPELESFHEAEVDFAKIKSVCKHFVVFHSDDDPLVPLEEGINLRNQVDGDIIIVSGQQHLNMGTGYFSFPEVVEELVKISQ